MCRVVTLLKPDLSPQVDSFLLQTQQQHCDFGVSSHTSFILHSETMRPIHITAHIFSIDICLIELTLTLMSHADKRVEMNLIKQM